MPGNLSTIDARRRAVQPPDPPLGRARTATSTSRTATATRASTASRRTASCIAVLGRAGHRPRPVQPAALRLGRTPTAASSSATARTTASRSSARRATCWTSGPTSPAPATCTSTRRTTSTSARCPGSRAAVDGRQAVAGGPAVAVSASATLTGKISRAWGGRPRPCAPRQLRVTARHLGRLPRRHLRRRGQQDVVPGHDLQAGVPFSAEVRAGAVARLIPPSPSSMEKEPSHTHRTCGIGPLGHPRGRPSASTGKTDRSLARNVAGTREECPYRVGPGLNRRFEV